MGVSQGRLTSTPSCCYNALILRWYRIESKNIELGVPLFCALTPMQGAPARRRSIARSRPHGALRLLLVPAILVIGMHAVRLSAATDPIRIHVYNANLLGESADDIYASLSPFVDYLQAHLGQTVKLDLFLRPADFERAAESGKPHFAFVSSTYFVSTARRFSLAPMAIPRRYGRPIFRKIVAVRKDSDLTNVLDLKGKRLITTLADPANLAFLSQILFGGKIVANRDFSVQEAPSATSALLGVILGAADAAEVTFSQFDALLAKRTDVDRQLRVIYVSRAFPMATFAAFEQWTSAALRNRVRDLLLAMEKGDDGRRALLALKFEGWEPYRQEELAFLWSVLRP
ncbi:MAG: phosphate/phosphite/phosphonate ABC transporter substrate-binding protein [Candidatus Schekmanbacteria bacterium]|nr:phosphate/phosphite/phosphonate ABC transporter substrate-binding protein [Candidatus Schekmanbacteria bacterium]